ncbi:Aste57867_1278 [Aphanomyces stellatus]|uniref:Aste57867_1278 protein n=1 Tax=Aphanomyces stellatus TaxID=120398 RepID=A0A485K580_9STRA|nr:hypothetical protein As57867_001277 [Aphanomyces stellatus]VFT78497.1 Aste57867_1278 [Aphanomyces stellatus]
MTWPEAPLVVASCCYLYMPLVLCLYTTHHHHQLIKYRQPHLIVLSGGLLTIYCLGSTIVLLWNASVHAVVCILVCFLAPILALATLLLSAMVVALHYKITELLVAPSEFPGNLIPTLTRYRWLLRSTNQRTCVVALTMIFFAEFLVAAGLAIFLTKQLSPIVDTFHLREAYQRSFAFAGMFVVVNIALFLPAQLLHLDTFGADYYSRHILNTFAGQTILYFHVVLPVWHVYKATLTTRIGVATEKPNVGTELQAYLQEKDGYESFLAFCFTECSYESATEELLAWRCIETFRTMRETPPTIDSIGPSGAMVAAEQVMTMCFGPGAPLATPTLTPLFETIYWSRWAAWKESEPGNKAPPPADFFDEYHRALIGHLASEFLPRFQAQHLSPMNTRSVQGLEMVHQLASFQPALMPQQQSDDSDDVQPYESSTVETSGAPVDSFSPRTPQPNDKTNDDASDCPRPASPTWMLSA